jgi:hypothetical protein
MRRRRSRRSARLWGQNGLHLEFIGGRFGPLDLSRVVLSVLVVPRTRNAAMRVDTSV